MMRVLATQHCIAIVGRVAQLVEQGIENPRVGGSIPSSATIEFKIQEACTFVWAFCVWGVSRRERADM